MKKDQKRYLHFTCLLLLIVMALPDWLSAQEKVVDRIVAVIGKNMILESEVEAQYIQYRAQGTVTGSASSVKEQILESMLLEKLLLNQAELDSIEVTDSEVEQTLDQRLRYFISQFGSQEKLEEFYQKSIVEIKAEFRDLIRDQLKVDKVQQDVTKNVSITPSDVKVYYKNLPKDSIPLINAVVQIEQIVKIPPVSMEQKVMIKERLRELRKRILNGERFATLAILYSEDPGSASKGGELGFYGRGELFPEFEAVAFKLNPGEVSEIVESKAGFHIMQMIERKGDYINVRHILLTVKPSPIDIEKAVTQLDSIARSIRNDSITFEKAAAKFSDDPGKNNNGLMINPYTNNTEFQMDQLDPQVSFVVDKLEIGEVSTPVPMKTEDGLDAYRIMCVKSRTEPHRANLADDYDMIQQWAMADKKQQKMKEWVNKNIQNAYVMIVDDYKDYNFNYDWFQEQK